MTDRVYAFTVALEKEIREDDAQVIAGAIKMIRGVLDVVPIVSDSGYHIAVMQSRSEIRDKIFQILWPENS